jgi:hypothetical protein
MSKRCACNEELDAPVNGKSRLAHKVQEAVVSSPTTARHDVTQVVLPSVLVGRIAAISDSHEVLVDFPGNTLGELVAARSLVAINSSETGRDVALMFEEGDPSQPIIVGLLQSPQASVSRCHEVKLDEETLILSARKEVVLQCGKSSITLTSAGKVLIRGAYLLSRSSGVNRIKGGSVQIN